MNRFERALAVVIVVVAPLGATACGAPATVDPLLVPTTKVSDPYPDEVMRSAIVDALFAKGWSVQSESAGELVASVTSGGHSATIRIRYDGTGWTIEHVESSAGLRYDPAGPNIHKRYNNWVHSLNRAIRQKLLEAGAPSEVSSSGAAAPTEEPAAAPATN